MSIGILSTGSYLPKEEVSNVDIAERVGVDEDWILHKTKIGARRFAADDEATSDLAAKAGAAALYSRSLDFTDRRTAVLLSDGAGAAIVGAVEPEFGILRIELGSRGDKQNLIRVEAGGSRQPSSHETIDVGGHLFRMEGRLVREFVLENVPPALTQLVGAAGVDRDQVRHLVPHQPNGVLLDELSDAAGFVNARTHRTLDRYGNVGSASVPVTLDAAHRGAELHDGELMVLTAFGGGMTTGHCLLRWGTRPAA